MVAVFGSINKDLLSPALGNNLEETIFEQFRRSDLKVVSQSANHRANVEIAAQLLGHLSNTRFETVADRFVAELKPVMAGYVIRDGDIRYENLVRGIRHIQLKVFLKIEKNVETVFNFHHRFTHPKLLICRQNSFYLYLRPLRRLMDFG